MTIDENIRIREEDHLMAALLATQEGRLFCGLLIEESGFLRNGLREASDLTAFAEGERNVGQRIFELAWRNDETKPLICMREYGDWCKQLGIMTEKEITTKEDEI